MTEGKVHQLSSRYIFLFAARDSILKSKYSDSDNRPETVLSLIAVFKVLFHKIIYTLSLSGAPSGRGRTLSSITRPPAGLKPRRNAAAI
jgi:hypothetical protein